MKEVKNKPNTRYRRQTRQSRFFVQISFVHDVGLPRRAQLQSFVAKLLLNFYTVRVKVLLTSNLLHKKYSLVHWTSRSFNGTELNQELVLKFFLLVRALDFYVLFYFLLILIVYFIYFNLNYLFVWVR